MTPEEIAAQKAAEEAKNAELIAKVTAETKKVIDESMKGYATEESVKLIKELAEKQNDASQLELLQNAVKDIETELKAAKENAGKKGEYESPVRKQLEEKKDKMAGLQKEKGTMSVDVKAFTTADNFNPDFATFLEPQFIPGIARTPDTRLNFNALQYVSVGRAFTEILKWIEEDVEAGTAQFIDECVQKPDVSKDWKRAQTEVKKLADYTRICDEVLKYVGWAEQEIRAFLRKMVYIGMQDAIVNGDGVGENILGITPQATAFVAGSKAASVFNANRSDAIMAVVSQINCLGFKADYVWMNCEDIFFFQTTKDLNGQYLSERLAGVQIVDCPFITPGSFLVGDFMHSNVRIFEDINVEMGFNGEDFRENAVSMRGEAWFAHYIASNHVNAFVFDTFANVVALIDKP